MTRPPMIASEVELPEVEFDVDAGADDVDEYVGPNTTNFINSSARALILVRRTSKARGSNKVKSIVGCLNSFVSCY